MLPTVTLTGRFLNPDDSPARAAGITLRLTIPMTDAADNVIVSAEAVRVTCDSQGAFSIPIVPSDGAGLVPTPVPYEITEHFGNKRRYTVLIPSDVPTIDLSDLAPIGVPPPLDGTPFATTIALAAEESARVQADALLIPLAQKGAPGGVPALDGSALILDANIPPGIARDSEVTAAVAQAKSEILGGVPPALLDTILELATQMQNDESGFVALTNTVAGKLNVVVHGATAGTARPGGALVTLWVGQATPANVVTDDLWIDKSVTPAVLRRYNGSAFDVLGGGTSGITQADADARYVAIANAAPLDTTAADIQPTTTGSPSAGSTSKSADAGHVHKIGVHASTHATGGTDAVTPAAIGAVATTAVGANNGVAQLDSGGKIPTSQLPAITMNTVWTVASQAAMLALSAEPGDVAVRTDITANFMLAALPASTLANWVQLAAPAGGVTSVFGRAGAVTLLKSDVTATGLAAADVGADASGAAATVQTNLTTEISRAQTAELARLLPRGAWAATTAYAVNDAVIAGGLSWRCISAHTSGSTFSGDLTKWEPQALLYEAIDTVAIASGTTTHTMSPVYLSTMKRYTLANTASCAFTLPAATAGASFSAIFEQDATGSRAFTIVPAGSDTAKWIPNVTPTFSTVASAADEVSGRCYVAGQWRLTANIGG